MFDQEEHQCLIVHKDQTYFQNLQQELGNQFENLHIYYFASAHDIPEELFEQELDIAFLNNLEDEAEKIKDVVQKIRQNSTYYTLIFVSGSADWKKNYQLLEELLEAGVDAFTPYPFQEDLLTLQFKSLYARLNYFGHTKLVSPRFNNSLQKLVQTLETTLEKKEKEHDETNGTRATYGQTGLFAKFWKFTQKSVWDFRS